MSSIRSRVSVTPGLQPQIIFDLLEQIANTELTPWTGSVLDCQEWLIGDATVDQIWEYCDQFNLLNANTGNWYIRKNRLKIPQYNIKNK